MTLPIPPRCLDRRTINRDLKAYHGLNWVGEYASTSSETSRNGLLKLFNQMLKQQKEEAEAKAQYRAKADASRLAEWKFHNAVVAMRSLIVGHFGSDSDEAQAIGLKKKSKHKRPSRPAEEEEV